MSLVRDDFKVLTHSLLLRAPETKGYLLPVDFALTKEAVKTNLETRKLSREFLSAEDQLLFSQVDVCQLR